MKKILFQIALIFIIIVLGMMSTFINSVNAEVVSLSAGTVKKGEVFSVGLAGLPAGAVAYQANVKVTYSDGTTKNCQKISYINYLGVTDTEQERSSVPADVAGTATITLYNIVVTDENSQNIQTTGTVTATVNIIDNSVTTAPAETTQTAPVETLVPATTTNTETPKAEQKEPEIVNPNFKEVNETVYAIQNCNVRSSCSTEIITNKIGGLKEGQEITRTGISNTWSRILYNGKTAYVVTRLLTTEKPVEEKETEITEDENKEEDKTEENTVNKENAEMTDEEKLKLIQEEIGVLPEVGNNVFVYMYIFVSVIALISVCIMWYSIKRGN